MAGFCTKCGKPLPEDGVCPCTLSAPAQPANPYAAVDYTPATNGAPAQPSAFSIALKNAPSMLKAYFRNPIGTSRIAADKRDVMSGVISALGLLIVSFLSFLFIALRYMSISESGVKSTYFPAAAWIVNGLFLPVIAVAMTIIIIYAMAGVSRVRVDFSSVLASIGVNCILPAIVLFVGMLLSMITPWFFDLACQLTFATWMVLTFILVTQVFGIKLSLGNILLFILLVVASYYSVALLKGWFANNLVGYLDKVVDRVSKASAELSKHLKFKYK